ncbi:MAG: hypothetical protein D3904_09825 [Candidatus Electrothrix sp. EH2]|nr:hypothetical protein [Candidatus Electrothrix sp. EH2]
MNPKRAPVKGRQGVIISETGEDEERPFRGRAGFVAFGFYGNGAINRGLTPIKERQNCSFAV